MKMITVTERGRGRIVSDAFGIAEAPVAESIYIAY